MAAPGAVEQSLRLARRTRKQQEWVSSVDDLVILGAALVDSSVIESIARRAGEVAVRIAVAVAVVAVFVLLSRMVRPWVRRRLARTGRPSRARVFSGLVSIGVIVAGTLIGATIAFPSVEIADVLASFGLLSVAVGFAFKDVLENLLAGAMLIVRDPFQSGDDVRVGDVEGTVEGITVRETLLRTFDGQRLLIPNARVFMDTIEVRTHHAQVRQTIAIDVDLEADLAPLRRRLEAALAVVDGVAEVPPVDVVATELSPDVRLECRFWTSSSRAAMTAARDQAIETIRRELLEADVPLPVEALTLELSSESDEFEDVGRLKAPTPTDGDDGPPVR
jgi:small conductance mechanosensitive channel